jgi:hypothetical protein
MPNIFYKRDPYKSELDYFKKNLNVGGMAAEDDMVIINPYSKLNEAEKKQVSLNEAARIYMRKNTAPSFDITEQQKEAFKNYGSEDDIRSTIASRILSGDKSALDVTEAQSKWVNRFLKPYVSEPIEKSDNK